MCCSSARAVRAAALAPQRSSRTEEDIPMRAQAEKAAAFRALHERPGAFIIPNPWDAGTARLLASLGFEALATTSLGLANTLGSATVSLAAIIETCRSTPIWRTAARMNRRPRPRPSDLLPRQGLSADRSRMRPATHADRFTIS